MMNGTQIKNHNWYRLRMRGVVMNNNEVPFFLHRDILTTLKL